MIYVIAQIVLSVLLVFVSIINVIHNVSKMERFQVNFKMDASAHLVMNANQDSATTTIVIHHALCKQLMANTWMDATAHIIQNASMQIV